MVTTVSVIVHLTIKQQKELLMLQLDHKNLINKELELEVMKQKAGQVGLIKEGKLISRKWWRFWITCNLELLLKFNEKAPDV